MRWSRAGRRSNVYIRYDDLYDIALNAKDKHLNYQRLQLYYVAKIWVEVCCTLCQRTNLVQLSSWKIIANNDFHIS